VHLEFAVGFWHGVVWKLQHGAFSGEGWWHGAGYVVLRSSGLRGGVSEWYRGLVTRGDCASSMPQHRILKMDMKCLR
jgi:hypothetical protein